MPTVKNIVGKKDGYKTVHAMRSLIAYAIQPGKTEHSEFVYVNGVFDSEKVTTQGVVKTFMADKELFGKTDGRMVSHITLSFHPDEPITPEQAFEYGKKFASTFYPEHQSLIAVHTDRKHLHVHVITNSVSFTNGKKISDTAKQYHNKQKLNDKLALEYGLTITEKGKHYDKSPIEIGTISATSQDADRLIKDESKPSFMRDLAYAVTEVMRKATSRAEFISLMAIKGWTTDWVDNHKHILFINQDGKKVRDSKLSKTFNLNINKEALTNEFERVARTVTLDAERESLSDLQRGLDAVSPEAEYADGEPSKRLIRSGIREQLALQREQSLEHINSEAQSHEPEIEQILRDANNTISDLGGTMPTDATTEINPDAIVMSMDMFQSQIERNQQYLDNRPAKSQEPIEQAPAEPEKQEHTPKHEIYAWDPKNPDVANTGAKEPAKPKKPAKQPSKSKKPTVQKNPWETVDK